MSRPQKLHKPLAGGFNEILAAVAMGKGKGKQIAQALQKAPVPVTHKPIPKKP
jgi:hypothetical protein